VRRTLARGVATVRRSVCPSVLPSVELGIERRRADVGDQTSSRTAPDRLHGALPTDLPPSERRLTDTQGGSLTGRRRSDRMMNNDRRYLFCRICVA